MNLIIIMILIVNKNSGYSSYSEAHELIVIFFVISWLNFLS